MNFQSNPVTKMCCALIVDGGTMPDYDHEAAEGQLGKRLDRKVRPLAMAG
jgi:hypothetical protein